ncbi:FAD-dependent monooxygenase [Dermacoccus sp. 147Ba]|uniref:FAD-dependent oxidoreductase n=1 Tax=unclassified Dermacoccus TaxID=2643059 RepID=UPI0009E20B1E|nr:MULTISPECIES: NAD(P)/FAD-dependent oxidoreductase [unclassified Dermacoccus]RYI20609.1 FAD-dependent monooxygenase [Dermacoccus sp. 147Ba]
MCDRSDSVLIVGAGPVGCALALNLRRLGVSVSIVERRTELSQTGSGLSFNLTLTERGMRGLPDSVRRRLYLRGAVLNKRIIHHRDGGISTQPYGTSVEHHLLSIPRSRLQDLLQEEATNAGAYIRYGTACVDVDSQRPAVLVESADGEREWLTADLIVGCDGAESAVRTAIARAHPTEVVVDTAHIPHGHAEITMDFSGADPSGMHLWPRGDHFLQAQPNCDGTFTTSLFKPLDDSRSWFEGLAEPEEVADYCSNEFGDVAGCMAHVETELTQRTPGQLRLVRMNPYHHGRTILVGDAAHTVVPFLGQGINCSFEDVAAVTRLVEQAALSGGLARSAPTLTQEYSAERTSPGHALADLSMRNLQELSSDVDDPGFHARKDLERRIHEQHPELFNPLYQTVAFSSTPYDVAQRAHAELSEMLDEVCNNYDIARESDCIIAEFVRRCTDAGVGNSHARVSSCDSRTSAATG